MRKRIGIFGGSLFQDIKLENGRYVTTKKQASVKLSKNHDIDNFSFQGLTVSRAKNLIQNLIIKGMYDDCILALGEADLDNSAQFQQDLLDIIDDLTAKNVRPLLVSLPSELLQDEKACRIQDIIDKTAVTRNIDYIYEGSTTKMVSYVVLDDNDMSKAILELC